VALPRSSAAAAAARGDMNLTCLAPARGTRTGDGAGIGSGLPRNQPCWRRTFCAVEIPSRWGNGGIESVLGALVGLLFVVMGKQRLGKLNEFGGNNSLLYQGAKRSVTRATEPFTDALLN
jgi:hypothetical protein